MPNVNQANTDADNKATQEFIDSLKTEMGSARRGWRVDGSHWQKMEEKIVAEQATLQESL